MSDLPPIRKIGATIPVSREVLLSAGLVEPTPEEESEEREADRRWRAKEAAAFPLTVAYLDALDAITDEPARTILDLHMGLAVHYPTCNGCDFGGYEPEEGPPWPCRTVDVIADHYGITKPDLLVFRVTG